MYILGIWDGHDAGAALIQDREIVFAVNEERLSRRKLEVGFPARSIAACLAHEGITPRAVEEVALSTTDPAKTLTRLVPGLKEEYYLIRRRKRRPGRLDFLKKGFKYRFTELGPNAISRILTRRYAVSALARAGFRHPYRLTLRDHHQCHAETAAGLSGFDRCAVITLDGVGDGLSGSVWQYGENRLHLIKQLPAAVSLGIFFEHVTNLMNMRELEDEGKVMALANYAYPIADSENPLLKLIDTRGLGFSSFYRSLPLYREMKRILWQYPSEQFAFMAQRTLESLALKLVKNVLNRTGEEDLALAGGVFSNIKLNMKIEETTAAKRVFVFPHMGDGGLGVGAAVGAARASTVLSIKPMESLALGPEFSEADIVAALEKRPFPFEKMSDPAAHAAELILNGEIILWFQGRMELGPRSLGQRSILARPDQVKIRDRLNLVLKKRVWYQPFCPSLLMEDAAEILDVRGRYPAQNRFMTTGFRVQSRYLDLMAGVMNVDGTCRPHLVDRENGPYRRLLLHVKKVLGKGVVLNTSFNIHGEPMVCAPEDALDMFARTRIGHLFLGDYLIVKGANG